MGPEEPRVNIIIEPRISSFLEKAIPCLRPIDTKTVCCHRCGQPIRLPLTARQVDVEAFQELLDVAAEFLEENGVGWMVLERLWEKIRQRMNLQ